MSLRKKYTEAGFSGNILKPYKPGDLLYKIEKILRVAFDKKERSSRKFSNDLSEYTLEEIFLFTGEDQESLDTILNVFIESTQMNLKEIEQALETNDHEKIAQIAHRMLPMFKQLKAKEIIPQLEKLENKDPEALNIENISDLLNEIKKLLFQLEKEVKA